MFHSAESSLVESSLSPFHSPSSRSSSTFLLDERERSEDAITIDGNRITLTHEELEVILSKERESFDERERKIVEDMQEQETRNYQSWLKLLEHKKEKKKALKRKIEMCNRRVGLLETENSDLRLKVKELEEEIVSISKP